MKRVLLLLGLIILLVSSVVLAQDDGYTPPKLEPPVLGEFDADSVAAIDPNEYPLLAVMTDHARYIFEQGQEAGRNRQVFSKVGDCMTASDYFLTPFGLGTYDLGEFSALEPVIAYFSEEVARQGDAWDLNAFATHSLAAESGFNTASVQDSIWADPTWCEANESPLQCELRVSNSAYALIMFGTNDVYFFEADVFDYYLRTIILTTIEADVVPVMSTFPIRPEYPDKSLLFNQIILKIAEDYELPVINLWLGLEALPQKGVDLVETIHLTAPEDGQTCVFVGENLEAGYTFRNLVTLQTLEVLQLELAAPPEIEE